MSADTLKIILSFGFLFSFVLGASLAFFVSSRHERSPVRDAFILQVVFGGIWLICSFLMLNAASVEEATVYSRLAYLGCIFLSVSECHLIVSFLNLQAYMKFIKLGYIIGAIVFVPQLMTHQLLEQVYAYSWGYWMHAGKTHIFFLIFASVYGLFGFIILLNQLRLATDKVLQQKIRLILIGYVTGYLTLLDMFPHYGFPVLPIGFLFANIYLFIFWFIIKYYDFFSMWRKIIR